MALSAFGSGPSAVEADFELQNVSMAQALIRAGSRICPDKLRARSTLLLHFLIDVAEAYRLQDLQSLLAQLVEATGVSLTARNPMAPHNTPLICACE